MRHKTGLTLVACAVQVLRHYQNEPESSQVEHVKRLAIRRGIVWHYGHEVTEALAQARKYEPIGWAVL